MVVCKVLSIRLSIYKAFWVYEARFRWQALKGSAVRHAQRGHVLVTCDAMLERATSCQPQAVALSQQMHI